MVTIIACFLHEMGGRDFKAAASLLQTRGGFSFSAIYAAAHIGGVQRRSFAVLIAVSGRKRSSPARIKRIIEAIVQRLFLITVAQKLERKKSLMGDEKLLPTRAARGEQGFGYLYTRSDGD
jgi:hypothetical protein